MQYTESSNNSTLVFKQVQIAQDFDYQRPIFKLIDTNPNLFCFYERPPFQIYGEQKKFTQIEESVFLGKGSFGKVYCVINYEKFSHEENIVCALKMHKNCNYEDIIQLANEYEIQYQLTKHISDFVVGLVDKVYINQQIVDSYEVSASIELGFVNLYEYIIKTNDISNEEFDTIYWQILNAIIKMHQLNIAHRDIKPSNIVYIQKKGWVLADFGCSQQYQHVQGFYQIVGTKAYLPQYLREQIQSFNRQQRVKMNLFHNDIHAFLITMLQIKNKNQTLQQLEQMVKNRQQNDAILSIYDKSFQEIKQKLSGSIKKALMSDMAFLRIVGKSIEESRNQDYESQRASERLYQHHINLFYEEQNKFKSYSMTQIFTSAMGNHFKYIESQYEQEIQRSQPLDLITSQTEKWQYDIIYKTLMTRGQIQKMLDLCQKYQGLVASHPELKLQEIELTICLGKISEAKEMLQEITQDAYNFDDASYLKYHCLKAELFPRDNQELWQKISKYYVYLSNIFQVSDGFFFLYTELRWQEQVYFNANLVRKDTDKKRNIPLIVYLNVKNSIVFQQINIENSFSESIFIGYCKLLQINQNEELVKQLEKRGFDRYAMFMSSYFLGMILSDIPKRHHQAKNLLEKAIYEYEIPNYYFNWRLSCIYAQVLIKLNLLEDAKKVLQQAESKLQEEQNQEKFLLELENWEIYIKQKLYLTNPELFERLPKFLLKIKSSRQKQVLIVSLLQRIQNEYLIASKHDLIILLELMEKNFEGEEKIVIANNNTDLVGIFIRFKLQLLLKQENMELVIENLNSILINLNRKGLLDSFSKNIWIFFDKINNAQRRSISNCKQVDVINYHQKLIQQEIIDTDLFPNEDRFQYPIGKSLSEYAQIIQYFKLTDKVAEFKQLNYTQNYVFRI